MAPSVPIRGQNLGQQTDIGQECLDGVGRAALVVEIIFPGIDGRDEAGLQR